MDDCERGQRNQERDTEIALKELQTRKVSIVSTGYCTDCGIEIPEARLKIILTNTCIDCAREQEIEERRWR